MRALQWAVRSVVHGEWASKREPTLFVYMHDRSFLHPWEGFLER